MYVTLSDGDKKKKMPKIELRNRSWEEFHRSCEKFQCQPSLGSIVYDDEEGLKSWRFSAERITYKVVDELDIARTAWAALAPDVPYRGQTIPTLIAHLFQDHAVGQLSRSAYDALTAKHAKAALMYGISMDARLDPDFDYKTYNWAGTIAVDVIQCYVRILCDARHKWLVPQPEDEVEMWKTPNESPRTDQLNERSLYFIEIADDSPSYVWDYFSKKSLWVDITRLAGALMRGYGENIRILNYIECRKTRPADFYRLVFDEIDAQLRQHLEKEKAEQIRAYDSSDVASTSSDTDPRVRPTPENLTTIPYCSSSLEQNADTTTNRPVITDFFERSVRDDAARRRRQFIIDLDTKLRAKYGKVMRAIGRYVGGHLGRDSQKSSIMYSSSDLDEVMRFVMAEYADLRNPKIVTTHAGKREAYVSWALDCPRGMKMFDGKTYYFVHSTDRRPNLRTNVAEFIQVTNRAAAYLSDVKDYCMSSPLRFGRPLFDNTDACVFDLPTRRRRLQDDDELIPTTWEEAARVRDTDVVTAIPDVFEAVEWRRRPEGGSLLENVGKVKVKRNGMFIFEGRDPRRVRVVVPKRQMEWNVNRQFTDSNQHEDIISAIIDSGGYLVDSMPGTGKSFIIDKLMAELERRKIPFVLVAPTNTAVNLFGKSENFKTIAKFVQSFRDDNRGSIVRNNARVFKFVIIDEGSMMQFDDLARIEAMLDVDPNIGCAAFGDRNQIGPVVREKDRYDGHCLDSSLMMHLCRGNMINLTVPHRTSDPRVRAMADHVLAGRRREAIAMMRRSNTPTRLMLAHTRDMCRALNEMMMEGPRRAAEAENRVLRRVMMKEGWAWLYVGLPVVVAETFHSKSAEIPSYYNADLGTMISIDEENERVEIELVVNTRERLENGGWRTIQERTIHVVTFKELALRWMVAFAMTIHRVQGKTINEPYMIFEAETMPINVLNTGLTRTTKSEYVLIPDTDLRKEVETRKKADQ